MPHQDLVDLASRTDSDTDIGAFLREVRETLQVDHAAYAGLTPAGGPILGEVTYPQEWRHIYAEKEFHKVDPTLRMAARSIAPVEWNRLAEDPHYDSVFRAARDFGIPGNGLTVPVRGPYGDVGLFSVARAEPHSWPAWKRSYMSDLHAVAVHLHDKVVKSQEFAIELVEPRMSAREVEILQWIAAGKSQLDVAAILSISQRTVEVHLSSARRKLDALTTAQAVARATGRGMIYPM